jgi:hypothetical protein
MNNIMLAAISGDAVVNAIVWLIIAGVIYWLVNWAIAKIGVPEPFNKVLQVVIVLAVVILLINALLTLVGHPMIDWRR